MNRILNRLFKLINIYVIVSLLPINYDILNIFKFLFSTRIKNNLLILLVFAAIPYLCSIAEGKKYIMKNIDIIFYLAAVLIISLFNSIDTARSILCAVYLLCLGLYSIFMVYLYGFEYLIKTVMWVLFVFSVLSIFYGTFIPNIGISYDDRYECVWRGICGNRIQLGVIMSLNVILSSFFISWSKKISNLLIAANLFMGIFLIYKSASASAYIVTAAAYGILYAAMFSKINIAFFIAFINCATYLVYKGLNSRWLNDIFVKYAGRESTLTGRTTIWKGIVGLIKERPAGYGLDAFWNTENPYKSIFSMSYFDGGHSHNGWLEILLQVGITGFIIFLIVIIKSMVKINNKGLREDRNLRIITCYFAYLFVYFTVEPLTYSYFVVNIFNFLMFISIVYINTHVSINIKGKLITSNNYNDYNKF